MVPACAAGAGHVRGIQRGRGAFAAAGIVLGGDGRGRTVWLGACTAAGDAGIGSNWVPRQLDNGSDRNATRYRHQCRLSVSFLEIIRRAGPVFFAQFNYLAVLAGVAWGAVIFGERLSIYMLLAMVLMFVGMFLAGYRRRSSQPP